MLLEYALQTILILPSAVALLLATCLLSLQLFVVPLHFLPDAVVTRLRRSPACYASDSSLVKAYDFVVVGGTLASHVWFTRLRKQHPKATILLLEPPLLDYRSLIFTFFAGLDIGVRHDVPYFRAYPYYRTTELTAKTPYVRSVIRTFEVLINELARDLAAHEDPAIKLPCYRIVQRVDPASVEKGALSCRHVFPIQYSGLRTAQNLKVLLGVESISWLGYTRDRRLAVQIDIQNQDQPFVFYVNHDLHLFDTVNATGSTEPSIQEHHFENLTNHQENDDDDDDEDGKVGNALHQRFYAFRRMSVDEDSCALWTFDLAEEFDGDPSADTSNAIEVLVGFGASTSHSVEKEEFFETATSFKVLQLTQVSDGWVGLEIQQTVYNDSKHHLMHWGYEMIQRVFDGLNSDGIVDIHSDTASVNTIPQSPSPTTELRPTVKRHSETLQHARVHRPTVDHLIVKDEYNEQQQQQRIPSYLARIWNLVFVDNNHHVSDLLQNPDTVEKTHPFSAKFARLLQTRACFQKEDPAVLRSTVIMACEVTPEEEDDEEDDDGRRSSYGSLSDLEGNYYSADPYSVAQEDDEESTSEHDPSSSSASSTSEGSVVSEASYDNSYANSGDDDDDDGYEREENQEEEEDEFVDQEAEDEFVDQEEEEEFVDQEEEFVDQVDQKEEEKFVDQEKQEKFVDQEKQEELVDQEEEAVEQNVKEGFVDQIEEETPKASLDHVHESEPEYEDPVEGESDYYDETEQSIQLVDEDKSDIQLPDASDEQEQEAMADEFVEELQEEGEESDEASSVEPDRHENVALDSEAPNVKNNQDESEEVSEPVEQDVQTSETERGTECFMDAESTAPTTLDEAQPAEEERAQANGKKKKKAKKQKRRA